MAVVTEAERLKESCVMLAPQDAALISQYLASSLKAVDCCIREYPTAKKYQPLMKTRGELKHLLEALNQK